MEGFAVGGAGGEGAEGRWGGGDAEAAEVIGGGSGRGGRCWEMRKGVGMMKGDAR